MAHASEAADRSEASDAQPEAPQRPETTANDDGAIVVTARRREERLVDTPVSVSVTSGETLQARGLDTVASLGKAAAGVHIVNSPRGSSTPFVVIRGQRMIDTTMVYDPPVIFYVNEVPWMRVNGLNQGLYDISNVQVLRGPQGTLFGKSTTGGAVLVTTAPADTYETGGHVRASLGNYDLRRLEAAANFVLNQNLAVRFAGVVAKRDGYIHARNIDYDLNNENYNGQRISVRYENGGLKNDLIASRFWSKTHGTGAPLVAFDTGGAYVSPSFVPIAQAEVAANKADFYGITVDPDFLPFESTKSFDVTNITTYEISDSITVKNVFAYRKIKTDPVRYDLEGTLYLAPYSAAYNVTAYTDAHQISDEFQVQGTSDNFDWMAGLFILSEKGSDGAFLVNGASANISSQSGIETHNLSYSALLSGTYRFGIEGLSISAGVRLTRDRRTGDAVQIKYDSATDTSTCGISTPSGPACTYPERSVNTEPSWSVSLNYKPVEDMLLYVAHRHGYRSGGIQNRITSSVAAIPFQPETLNDVEVGAKVSTSLGETALGTTRLTLNIDAYRGVYKDLQRSVSYIAGTPPIILTGIANAAGAVIQGIEAEGSLRVGNLTIGGNFAYTDAHYKTYVQSITPTQTADLSDLPFGYVPEWTAQASLDYSLPLSHPGETLDAGISYQYVSKTFTSEARVRSSAFLPGYNTVDARLAWNKVAGTGIDLSFVVSNLTKEKYYLYSNNNSGTLGIVNDFPAAPRRFQFTLGYNF
ncbi:hypothetical protein JI59_08820 [Novosphingobium pentaromativorans US6-1]|nr:hypothetical protein JI59_08820 [Novosphingobium pentaromativorans US6-1]